MIRRGSYTFEVAHTLEAVEEARRFRLTASHSAVPGADRESSETFIDIVARRHKGPLVGTLRLRLNSTHGFSPEGWEGRRHIRSVEIRRLILPKWEANLAPENEDFDVWIRGASAEDSEAMRVFWGLMDALADVLSVLRAEEIYFTLEEHRCAALQGRGFPLQTVGVGFWTEFGLRTWVRASVDELWSVYNALRRNRTSRDVRAVR
jgi:hypothetical protein